MASSYKFLRIRAQVFRVLAWVTLGIPTVTGVILIIVGGEPVLLGGLEVPARVIGLLNLVAGALYFFLMWLVGGVIRLLLDIREHLPDRCT